METSENRYSYSHKQHVLSDSLRGLAVGIRGVLEAKRMAREAKSGRERRIADHYVRLKRLDLQERRLAISEGAAATEMEQARLDSLQAEQAHKDEWHQQLAETHDRLESLYRERNRAATPKEMERIDKEIAMEARAVVRLGKNLGYSYPHIEQGLQEREDAAIEFEEKSGRIDALDISDEGKAQLHTALENEFFGIGTGEDAKIDEILEAIENRENREQNSLLQNREQNSLLQNREQNSLLQNREQNSLLQNREQNSLLQNLGGDVSGTEAAASKEEVLQVLEENKDAFSEEEYAGIKEQIELGEIIDIKDFIKFLAEMGSDSTETDDVVGPSEFVDILVGDAESIMQAENLTPEDYVTSVESQLRERYPELSDEEIGSLMDEFREKADLLAPETEEEENTESENGTVDRPPEG